MKASATCGGEKGLFDFSIFFVLLVFDGKAFWLIFSVNEKNFFWLLVNWKTKLSHYMPEWKLALTPSDK